MNYRNIQKAVFLSRPNRFIAVCALDGRQIVCHVKNTGRCRELLIPGCTVYLEKTDNAKRKTGYDLVAVMKGDWLFNIDAQLPNQVVAEWLTGGGLFHDLTLLRPETVYGNSRFDFYAEHGGKRAFLEVKGVTLEENDVLYFPDAPTLRGVKHLYELCAALKDGYEAYLIFIVQTEKGKVFTPNRVMHRAFADALTDAVQKGVQVLCFNCHTSPEGLTVKDNIPVILSPADQIANEEP